MRHISRQAQRPLLERREQLALCQVRPPELQEIHREYERAEPVVHAAADLMQLPGRGKKHIAFLAGILPVRNGHAHRTMQDDDNLGLRMPVIGHKVGVLRLRRGIDLEWEALRAMGTPLPPCGIHLLPPLCCADRIGPNFLKT